MGVSRTIAVLFAMNEQESRRATRHLEQFAHDGNIKFTLFNTAFQTYGSVNIATGRAWAGIGTPRTD